jgi:hypothetical protein
MKKNILLIIFITVYLFSCINPPDSTEEINYLDFLNTNILFLKALKDQDNNLKSITEKIYKNIKGKIIVFEKGSKIIIDTMPVLPDDDTFVYSSYGNKFIVNKDFYFTILNGNPAYSLNNKEWYYIKNDSSKNIQGIHYKYAIQSEKNNNEIFIKYSLSISMGSNPEQAHVKKDKEIISLTKGMVFSTSMKNEIKQDLSKKSLFISKNTILSGYHIIRGNFIDSAYLNGKINITALKSIYLYSNSLSSFYVSLDKKKWGLNISSLKAKSGIEIYAKEDNDYFFNISTAINYSNNKILFVPSILKFILWDK